MTANATPGQDTDDSDRCLLTAIARGESRALEELYCRHWRTLLTYLIQQLGDYPLAEEVLQDVMLAVWKGASGFRGECQVRTWLLAIARKRANTARRRQPGTTLALDEDGPSDLPLAQHPTHHPLHDDVLDALAQLSAIERETIQLIFYHGLSGADVAAVMGVPEGTIRSRIRRAKARLHSLLSAREPADA